MITKHFILQLTFTNSQVSNFLEELGVYQEGHLTQSDGVSRIYWLLIYCKFKLLEENLTQSDGVSRIYSYLF